ncbi:MAG: winged helix-turn-helix domain-containing protein [Thermoplasmatota archaeon]
MMINTWEQFGRNAGRIWQTLDKCGELSKEQLQEKTKLRPYEIDISVGWLARENKIACENETYRISETNLTPLIGTHAGVVWETLQKQGESSVDVLTEETSLHKSQIYEAVGWLAREDKLNFSTKQGD